MSRFQDSVVAGDLEYSKVTSGEILCIFGNRTFVPISWMCKKQTSVSIISTESEIISLDAGLRMDGITALDLWDVVKEVLHSSNNKKSSILGAAGNCLRNINTKLTGNQNVDQLSDLDHVASNASSSQCDAELYIFGDNRSSDRDDHQMWKSSDETRVQNLQCRAFFGCSTESTWTQKPKSNVLTPKIN